MSIGPVEYMIVAFPGNEFKGEILPELARLQDTKTIRIIDLAIVVKDENGKAEALEVTDLDSEFGKALSTLLGNESGGLLNTDDLMAAADELENNSSAALLVWEDVWATNLRDAIVNAGGELWDLERVPREVVQAAVDFAESN
ncbi:MAG TPA: DUF6325 family protein [Actinomycetota bacterium]|jgi:hypothetical protein|nr:DUF6325 family protein [Actinomycetota bacterium]